MYYLDWLRIIGIGIIFIFHILCIFCDFPWIISNDEHSTLFYYILDYITLWIMPLFFIISGYAMYYSLYFKGFDNFIKDKLKRLIVPFIFGVFFIAPTVVYYERVFDGDFNGSYLEFLSSPYFQGLYGFGGNFAWMGMHLWFLLFLFLFMLIGYYPAKYFFKDRKKPLFDNITEYMKVRGVIFILIIPIIISFYISRLEPVFLSRELGRWSLFIYGPFFFYGFLFAYDKRYDIVIDKNWKIALIIAVLSTSLYLWMIMNKYFSLDFYHPGLLIPAVVSAYSSVITLIGFFRNYINKNFSGLGRFNEAILPVYILHMPIIVIVGYYVIKLEIVMILKLALVIIISFFLIVTIYYFLIRRFTLFRILFGMKTGKKYIEKKRVLN